MFNRVWKNLKNPASALCEILKMTSQLPAYYDLHLKLTRSPGSIYVELKILMVNQIHHSLQIKMFLFFDRAGSYHSFKYHLRI